MTITIQQLAQKRNDLLSANTRRDEAWRKWEEMKKSIPEYIAFESENANLEIIQGELTLMESAYKKQGIAIYQETGEKSYLGGTVRVSKSYSYDESIIIPFLREHKHDNLIKESIDKAKVKKLSEATDVPGVTVGEKVSATLNSDLSEFLEQTND